MDLDTIITDPSLRSTLAASAETKASCLSLLSSLSSQLPVPSASTQPQAEPPPPFSKDVPTVRSKSSLHASVSQLRGLNRHTIQQIRATKAETAAAKSELDTLHLQLQNLLYEQSHLLSEIAAAEGYDHSYASLPLIPPEQFLELRPELAEQGASDHDIMIARIQHEKEEREKLEAQRQELLKRKQGLIKENQKRREDLASLDVDLERFIDAARPIQRIFEGGGRKEGEGEKEKEKEKEKENGGVEVADAKMEGTEAANNV